MDDHTDAKARVLKEYGALNLRAEEVTDELFCQNEFFDARDLVLVKYEMLRRVRIDGQSVTQAARAFGFSRVAFYQAQAAFEEHGLVGLIPKAIISTYLCFFPVTVGMVKGLRSPDPLQLDLMHTYSASRNQTFWKLRWPASMPFLLASLKVAVALSLVGAIVGELPTGAKAGIGARLLAGSYYGQTIQIWSALIIASLMAGCLVALVGVFERIVLKRMGTR